MAMPGALRVAIAGGSIGGLTAAVLLRDLGSDVHVFERSATELQGLGAGIVAEHRDVAAGSTNKYQNKSTGN